ncbi:hypothetical protein ILUMI_15983, partial [Ignelater luminosus]
VTRIWPDDENGFGNNESFCSVLTSSATSNLTAATPRQTAGEDSHATIDAAGQASTSSSSDKKSLRRAKKYQKKIEAVKRKVMQEESSGEEFDESFSESGSFEFSEDIADLSENECNGLIKAGSYMLTKITEKNVVVEEQIIIVKYLKRFRSTEKLFIEDDETYVTGKSDVC